MFKNYFKTAFRSLMRNKSFALINIAGLGLGIASCLLIFLVVQFELSFDTFHKKKDRIYRVTTWFNRAGALDYSSGICNPAPAALRMDFPQLESVAAVRGQDNDLISVTDNNGAVKKFKVERGIYFAEPQLFGILDVSWLAGNPATALSEPNSVVLAQSEAEKYFGDWKQAMGKVVTRNTRANLKVTGIIKDQPVTTDFPLNVIISYKGTSESTNTDWITTASDFNCLIVLPAGMTQAQFDAQLPAFFKKHTRNDNSNIISSFHLQPLRDIHFDDRFGNYNGRTFSKKLISALSLIALFLLVVASVNFINLATAQAVNRSKEVGVRKVLGGSRKQLISQFLGETFLITCFSVIVALLISWLALPLLGRLLDVPLGLSHDKLPAIGLFLALTILSVTVLSGFYPAVILSGFSPIRALKSKITSKSVGGLSLRRGLVILQFTIAQVLIIGTLVVVSQMNFFKNAPMGFAKDAIVNTPLPADSISHTKTDVLRNELLRQPGIKNISFSFAAPSSDDSWSSDFTFDRSPTPTPFEPSLKWADSAYVATYGLQLIAGRNYIETDTAYEFMVNETVTKKLGIKNPADILGKEISFWERRLHGPVVGVVKDFHSTSLREPIAPVVLACKKRNYRTIGIKIEMSKAQQALAAIEKEWNKNFPAYIYEYKFLNDQINSFYKQENQLSKLYTIFAAIAIFISCLGLYGLVSFMAAQRTREVGIRKVLGASVGHIVYLFSREFTLLIGIAFLIAAPLAWYIMHQWLGNFAFAIKPGAGFFILAAVGSLLVAWITVGYKSISAALANPVKSLRTE